MLAPGNYVQWKSRIKRYINTKPNHELIHHCLKNPPYKFTWADKKVPISKGSPVTRTKSYMVTYKTNSQDIRDQLNAEAEVVQIILTRIDNDIYLTVNACPNACEMWKAIERLKQEWHRFVTLVKQNQELKTVSYHKLFDILKQYQNKVNEIRAERIARVANPLALIAQQQPVYHPHNHPTHYTQNSSTGLQQAATRNRGKAIVNSPQPIYDQEPSMVAEDDETSKDKEIDKLMALISLSSTRYENQRIGNVSRARETVGSTVDDTDDESEDQELEAHYMYMAQLQEVSPDAAIFGPIFDTEPVQKVSTDDHYNVFAIKSEHPEQSKSVHDTYPIEQDEHNNPQTTVNNKLSETNNLMYNDFKKSQAELARRNDVQYASKVEIDYAKARGDLISYKMESQKSFYKYTQTINDLNHIISKMKEKLCAHQETISILSQQKEAQIKLYKTREDNELDKVNALENKVKVLDNIVYKTDQSVQTMNMLNHKCRTSFENLSSLRKLKDRILVVIPTTSVSRPQLKSNPMGDRVMRKNSQRKKQDVEDHHRNVKFYKNKTFVTTCNDSLKAKTLNVNFVCATCGKCVLNTKHDMCVLKYVNGVHSWTKMPIVMPVRTREPKRTVKQYVAKPFKKIVASESNHKPRNITRKLYERVSKACSWWYPKFTPSGYKWKPKSEKENVNPNLVEIVLFIVDSGCSKHMTGNLKLLINFVENFLGTVKFRNDQFAPILGYGDLVQGAVMIKRVYYVEGLNHNLFFVGQFCDADLEVAFRKSTCYICDLKGNDLLIVMASSSFSSELRHHQLAVKE
nr:hypothetical protein [Tanacetum cinerariifolium]